MEYKSVQFPVPTHLGLTGFDCLLIQNNPHSYVVIFLFNNYYSFKDYICFAKYVLFYPSLFLTFPFMLSLICRF